MGDGSGGFWSRLLGSSFGAGTEEDARRFLQHRVALFLWFEGAFLGTFYLIDAAGAVADFGPSALARLGLALHLSLVLSFFGGWLALRNGNPSRSLLQWAESIATLSIAGFVLGIVGTIPAATIAVGPVLGVALTLVARAAIVPSSGKRTFLLGVIATVTIAFAYSRRTGDPEPLTFFVAVWTLAFSAASALVSRVIYGLQEKVREASRLGQYQLESKLGEGGMGAVYRARHAMLRRPTAVKLLLPARAGRENLARFEREVQQTARLSHPNTVTIFDYGRTPEGVLYYAMELLDGANLDEIVAIDGAQDVGRVVHIVSCVAGALTEAHEAGLIHRDIKPANIVLCQQGGVPDVPKVVDFGLVKQLGEVGMTQADTLTGTPLYMSPESITAPDTMDARSDLYALGAVTFFLLTGRHVFEGETVVAVCSQHLTATPDAPSAHSDRPIPEALDRLVLDCLAKEPTSRPATARELQERLAAVTGFEPWGPTAARRWWSEHGAELRERHPATATALGETLAVDLAGRREAD